MSGDRVFSPRSVVLVCPRMMRCQTLKIKRPLRQVRQFVLMKTGHRRKHQYGDALFYQSIPSTIYSEFNAISNDRFPLLWENWSRKAVSWSFTHPDSNKTGRYSPKERSGLSSEFDKL